MSIKLVTLEAFNSLAKRLLGYPFYILEEKTEIDTTESLRDYIENNFNSLFNYGINIRRIGTRNNSGSALVIADKNTNNGKYCSYMFFGYGNDLTVRRCINGTWYNAN